MPEHAEREDSVLPERRDALAPLVAFSRLYLVAFIRL
jgi:hypothetical protein